MDRAKLNETAELSTEDAIIRKIADTVIDILQKDELRHRDLSKATNFMAAASQISSCR